MKKIFSTIIIALAACMSFVSCSSDDEVVKTPLDAPTISAGATTVSSLAFTWDAVEGATQYAYELYDASGTLVLGDVTTTTSLLATGLKDNATYTLKVWAFAAVKGDKGTSPIAEITATTNQIVPLANPDPTAEGGTGSITITWPEVEHAASYTYSYLTLDGETVTGSTETNSITLRGLATGDYTVYITAISGEEAYSDSQPIAVQFHFESKNELWRKEGWYWSAGLQDYFEAVLVAYDNGTYTIEHPFGEEGYDIQFSVNSSNGIEILNSYSQSGGYYYVATSSQYYVAAYTASGYSAFEPEADNASGSVWFCTYTYDYSDNMIGSWGYDQFIWSAEESEMTVDDLVGTYTSTDTGQTYFNDWSTWQTVNQSETVTITKVDDTTVTIGNFFGWEEDVNATFDADEKTLALELKTDWGGGYYTLCVYDKPAERVVGTIDSDGTITFEDYTAYYPGYASSYLYGMKSVLTKQ